MKIKATLVKASELKPGDLFSTEGPEYWSKVDTLDAKSPFAVGERVFIRTAAPTPVSQADHEVYRVEVVPEEAK